MKKILLGLAFLGLMTKLNAQQMVNKEFVSTVGRAEEEVTPDIIYIDVTLKEFYDNGNTKKKVAIDKLEKDLFDSATKAGVKKEDFTIQNIWSYNTPEKKEKGYGYLAFQTIPHQGYQLKQLRSIIGWCR